jgi:hypothetical protein
VRLSDLRTHLQLRRSDTSYSAAALNDFLNQAYFDIAGRRAWGWLRRVARYETTAAATIAVTGTAGQRVLTPDVTPPPPTMWGRRILLDGRVYRIDNVLSVAGTFFLDHPLHKSPASENITVLYDEIALPRSADTVVAARLITGSTPRRLEGIEPWQFSIRSRASTGQPSHFSTIRKTPIPVPDLPPPVPALDGGTSGGPAGGTYTYWMSYVDRQSGAESALSPARQFVHSGTTEHVLVAVTATEARSDFYFRLYRSKAATTDDDVQPYLVAQSTGVIETIDDGLADQYLGRRAVDSGSSLFLTLYPAPSAGYEIEIIYQSQVHELGEGPDTPMFDETAHPVIIDGAEMLMLQAHEEWGAANQARERYEAGIARMVQRDRLSQATIVPIGNTTMTRIRAEQTAQWWEFVP